MLNLLYFFGGWLFRNPIKLAEMMGTSSVSLFPGLLFVSECVCVICVSDSLTLEIMLFRVR